MASSFKDEWDKAGDKGEDIVQEIIDDIMDSVIRSEEASPLLKLRAAEVLLEHFKKDKSSLPNGIPSNVDELTELQLIKIIKDRGKLAKN